MPIDRVTLIQCDTDVCARPGHDVREPVDADQLQRGEPGAGARATAREALLRLARHGSACRSISSTAVDGVDRSRTDAARGASATASWSADEVQPDARPDGEAETGRRVDGARQAGAARRHAGDGDRAASSSSTTCACPACCTARVVRPPASARRWPASTRARSHPAGRRQGRRPEELRRRRRREAVAGDAGGADAEGDVDARTGTAGARRLLRSPADASRSRDAVVVDSSDVDETLAAAARRSEGDLSASRTRCTDRWAVRARWPTCRADRRPSGRRRSRRIRRAAASRLLLGLPLDEVRVIFTRGSGCYGINGADTVSYDAALLSQAVGRPVRVQLSRKDEMAWENYGFAYVIDQRVALDGTAARSSRGTTNRGRRRSAAGPATRRRATS